MHAGRIKNAWGQSHTASKYHCWRLCLLILEPVAPRARKNRCREDRKGGVGGRIGSNEGVVREVWEQCMHERVVRDVWEQCMRE